MYQQVTLVSVADGVRLRTDGGDRSGGRRCCEAGYGGNTRFTWEDAKGCIMSEDTTRQKSGLLNVSNLTLRQCADELDESSLAATLRRLLDPREGYGEEISGFNSALPLG